MNLHTISFASKILAISALLLVCHACSSVPQKSIEQYREIVLFLQNNIHAQGGARDSKASYANWTDPGVGHFIIQVNTPVKFGSYRRGLTIKDMTGGRKVYFEFNASNMRMSADQYIELIASPQKAELNDLSEIDQKGVRDGKAYIGMSKNGVRIALGYPAPHRTPSLESSSWVYWRNRWKTRVVEFGDDQRVKNIKP
jgi:hypothetical protein